MGQTGSLCYLNGDYDGDTGSTVTGTLNNHIGNASGGAYPFYGKVQAYSMYSVKLTSAQAKALATAMAAL
jgi:hypothetical protein